jgi:D-amino-acid dehydrogenase
MQRDAEIVVIGGGVIGSACALVLARSGRSVLLIDRGEPRRACSFGNAGHIATEQRVPLASPQTVRDLPRMLLDRKGPLAIRPGVLPQILRDWGWRFLAASRPSAYRRGCAVLGPLVDRALDDLRALLAGSAAAPRLLERGHHLVWQAGTAETIAAEAARLKAAGLPARPWGSEWPALPAAVRAGLRGGLTFTATAHVTDPWRLVEDVGEAFLAQGGRRMQGEVRALLPQDGGWQVDCGDRALMAEQVLLATGIEAPALLAPLGHRLPMIAERGYHVAIPGEGVAIEAPVVFKERGFILTPMESELRATTTTEFSPLGAPPDPRRPALLRRHLVESGWMSEATPSRDWMGNRPTLPDYLPVIGRSRRHPGLILAFGHQHLGLTLSGVTARMVRDLVAGHAAPPAELAIERFERS